MLHVTHVKYLENYTVWIRFDDGVEGLVDLEEHLIGPVFEPLKDQQRFQQVVLDEELATVAWPNGADLAPEFLKEHLQD